MIIDYKILTDWESDLGKQVQSAIGEGWQPYGDPFFDGESIHQVVVKYASTPFQEVVDGSGNEVAKG